MPGPAERNAPIIAEFRANEGVVGGDFAGIPLLLLTTKGAKSGEPSTTPLAYLRDGDRWIVFASYGGRPMNPAWYHNLVASPGVEVEVGSERFRAVATVLEGDERALLYRRQVAAIADFAGYEARAGRVIPVIALRREAERERG
jgi:deazaflavin-dependent oxidoreductase (nitroreductase family)